jgi:hypothetical protein
LTGGEFLPAYYYDNRGVHWHGLLPDLVLSKLVVPPLQPRMVGPYPICDVWFPNGLLLVGTGHNQIYGP